MPEQVDRVSRYDLLEGLISASFAFSPQITPVNFSRVVTSPSQLDMSSYLDDKAPEGYSTPVREPSNSEAKAAISQGSISDDRHHNDLAPDWNAAEEKKLVRKIDSIVMPLLILGFFALQFDRGNM
jgi:hypothetical protein